MGNGRLSMDRRREGQVYGKHFQSVAKGVKGIDLQEEEQKGNPLGHHL